MARQCEMGAKVAITWNFSETTGTVDEDRDFGDEVYVLLDPDGPRAAVARDRLSPRAE